MAFRYWMLLGAGVRFATSSCSINGTTTIQDAFAIATCTTFSGSIAIATDVSEEFALDGIQVLDGNFNAVDVVGLTSVSADSLSLVTGWFTFDNLRTLESLDFPQLEEVGILDWRDLWDMNTLSFSTGLRRATAIQIENTALESVDGLDIGGTLEWVQVQYNRYLQDFSLPITNITDKIWFWENEPSLSIDLPLLRSLGQENALNNCSAIDLPLLESSTGFMFFTGSALQELTLPNLQYVGEVSDVEAMLWISDNSELSKLSMPALESVYGDLRIYNNPKLESVDDFPRLSVVGQSLTCNGSFTSLKMTTTLTPRRLDFPSIIEIGGAFTVKSSEPIDCPSLRSLYGLESDVYVGDTFTCESGEGLLPTADESPVASPTAPTSPTPSSDVSKDEGLSRGAKIGIGVGVGVGVVLLAVGLAALLIRRRRQRQTSASATFNRENNRGAAGPVMEISNWQMQEVDQSPAEIAPSVRTEEHYAPKQQAAVSYHEASHTDSRYEMPGHEDVR
ncbi:cell wall protein Ecm33 [Vermiconidia calcicola]|uniref:Cell wall protein Ecm33 n=1 Tax=Vermiconidia calcicola TaxID=1690605 RepID=A0ACC3NX84_9PEZI|nr:cell wall protein Ecm33 [Vermiconidia calcicola]